MPDTELNATKLMGTIMTEIQRCPVYRGVSRMGLTPYRGFQFCALDIICGVKNDSGLIRRGLNFCIRTECHHSWSQYQLRIQHTLAADVPDVSHSLFECAHFQH